MLIPRSRSALHAILLSAVTAAVAAAPAGAVETVNDDQVVLGSQCVGRQCTLPARALHAHVDDTPALRLEQSGGGFGAYTWDVAGNEANFFVRDVSAGNRLVFRIFPGAASNALAVRGSNVGIGTADPQATLNVSSTTDAQLRVENTDTATATPRVLADLVNSGPPLLRFRDTRQGGQSWIAGPGAGGAFVVRGAGASDPHALAVSPAGTVTARGVLQQGADAALLADVQEVDGAELLAALRGLEVQSWTTPGDASGARHLAPTGSAFQSAFGLGGTDVALAPGDMAGVALVATQELARRLDAVAAGAKTGATGATGPAGAAAPADPSLSSKVSTLERANAAKDRTIRSLTRQQRTTARQLAALKRQVAALAKQR